jgi:hypothetical protein
MHGPNARADLRFWANPTPFSLAGQALLEGLRAAGLLTDAELFALEVAAGGAANYFRHPSLNFISGY